MLHSEIIPYSEWCSLISANDTDEKHFLIRKGAVPCGYLKINGLEDGNDGWISILAVASAFQRKGIGKYAVSYAESFLKSRENYALKYILQRIIILHENYTKSVAICFATAQTHIQPMIN